MLGFTVGERDSTCDKHVLWLNNTGERMIVAFVKGEKVATILNQAEERARTVRADTAKPGSLPC